MSVSPQGMGAFSVKIAVFVLQALLLATEVAEARHAPLGPSAQSHAQGTALQGSLFDIEEEMLEPDEEDHDVFSFFGVVTDMHRRVPASSGAATAVAATSEETSVERAAPTVPETEAGWEGRFEWGMYYSAQALAASESCTWTRDRHGSEGGVPETMLRAEELLLASEEAPLDMRRLKIAERALRIYYHAKWLAERNYARAAEFRYKQAADLAIDNKRRVLAAHSLSRLGFFLMYWNRKDEAKQVLVHSVKLSTKSNPLAPFLLGVLGREAAGGDEKTLLEAEARVLEAESQPSEELNMLQAQLSQEIKFWRSAKESSRHCFRAPAVPHFFICVLTHAVDSMWQVIRTR